MTEAYLTLVFAALSVGAIHTMLPDHWVPFAVVGQAERWSLKKTLTVTTLAGFGHVTSSVILGVLGILIGLEMLKAIGQTSATVAGYLLIMFGLIYAGWGLRRLIQKQVHGHQHNHYDHIHRPGKGAIWSLVALFTADPCVAVMPIMFAALPFGWLKIAVLCLLFELTTIVTMVILTGLAATGLLQLRFEWLKRYGTLTSGLVIAIVGVVVMALGV